MKFISFGDLIEVTYNDGSIELISKEKAAELDYKERQQSINKQKIQITYQNKIFTGSQFANITGIDRATVGIYYKRGLHTGEEIIAAYNKCKTARHIITYGNQEYTTYSFSKLTGISEATIQRYYNKGLRTGEEILESYKSVNASILYNNTYYNMEQFSRLTQISNSIINRYYKKGLRTGEEMLAQYAKNGMRPKSVRTITYKKQQQSLNSFVKSIGMDYTSAVLLYNKGIRTGEELLTIHNSRKRVRKEKNNGKQLQA